MRTGWHITAASGWWAVVALALEWLISGAPAGYAADPPNAINVVTTNFPTLTNAVQVLNLPAQRARTALPVCIRGLVTSYCNGVMLFVQDETAGIYVYHTGERLPLRPGAPVQVTGVTGQGRYSPIVIPSAIEALPAYGPVLKPKVVSLAEIYYGGLDEQWVEVSGTLGWLASESQRLEMQLLDPPYRSAIWIVEGAGERSVPPAGSRVRIRGVVGASVTERGDVDQFRLIVNTLADLTVLCPAPADPFAEAVVPIAEISAPHVRSSAPGLVHVRGIVTLHRPPRQAFIQDVTGGLEVQSDILPAVLRPGTVVDVVGLLNPVLEPPRMEAVYLRTNATPGAVLPCHGSAFQQNPGGYESQLVEIDCSLLRLTYLGSNGVALALGYGERLITAYLDASPPQSALAGLEPGALVRATGVWRKETKADSGLAGVLFLRGRGDLLVIRPPLPQTPNPILLTGIITVAIAALAAALWFWWRQQIRTRRCLAGQAALQAEMRHGEAQLRRAMEERERIGRDLHDEIIQSIYAVGLTLEDCRRTPQRGPEQNERRLAAAIDTLNSTIRSIRGFIAGLEPKILNGREFKTALKSLALVSGDDPAQFRIEVDPAAANGLTASQATQLLHIAKEAMSNSLRHAHASNITVLLHPLGTGVCLEVCDDGEGLPPQVGESKGHGLRNMSARAREIGADLQIVSAPGRGCRILVTVPQADLHEPK